MILLDLKRYIKDHGQVSLAMIQTHFDLDEAAAHALLAPLLKQGHVTEIPMPSCTTGECTTGCAHNHSGPSYQWTNKPVKSLSIPIQIL